MMSRAFCGGVMMICAGLVSCGLGTDDDGGVLLDAGAPDAGAIEAIPEDCNPVGGPSCLLPWPSTVYLEDDASTATGYRVALPEQAMPANRDGNRVDPTPYNRRDGFGLAGPITVAFPDGISSEGLPPLSEIGASLAEDSPIILLDMDRVERHPLFAEVDENSLSTAPGQRALIIRPMEGLRPGTRYAVAIRDTATAPGGEPLPVPRSFRAIRDGEDPPHARAQAIAPRYEAIFAALDEAGVARDELVLAWDFVTASSESLTADLTTMRDLALEVLEAPGHDIAYAIEELLDDDDRTLRLVAGTFEAPNFLTAGEEDESVLARGDDDLPALDGAYEAELTAVVPACAETAELPIPITIVGHGIFGSSRQELRSGTVRNFAEDHCTVVLGSDWIGLSRRQAILALLVAGDVSRLPQITEKLPQAVINFMTLERAARGSLADDPLFQREAEAILDPQRVQYYGISLGGIMGGVLMAYEPNIERGALGVGGGAWSLLLERSDAWNALQGPLFNAYGNQLTYQTLLALLGLAFEPYDPMATARRVLDDPLPGVPPKQIFIYAARGDSTVSNVGTFTLARTMGLFVTGPSVFEPFGLDVTHEQVPSGLTIYDQKPEPFPPETNVPPQENSTHVEVRDVDAVSRQLEGLFSDGVVRHECAIDGEPAPCDCTAGAC